MAKLKVSSKFSFKENITAIELEDITGDGKTNLILATMNGDVNIFDLGTENKIKLNKIGHLNDISPISCLDIGDISGDGIPDIIVGRLDNTIRVFSYLDGKFCVRESIQLGSLPTAVCAVNVVDDKAAEVIVATNDGILRCYGWFDVCLDKLAHKVIRQPTFSIRPLLTQGVPYGRFVFGDTYGF